MQSLTDRQWGGGGGVQEKMGDTGRGEERE